MRPLYTLGFVILSFFASAQTPTIVSKHVLSGDCTAVAYGNGLYVAGSSGTFTSTDAKTWNLLNPDSVPSFSLLTFGNGIFVGASGTSLYSSTNGINWTLRTNFGDFPDELLFTDGVFYAVGPNNGIITSSDGINWAGLNLGIDIPTPIIYNGIAYNGSVYVIGVTVLGSRFSPNGSCGVLYSTTGLPGSWVFTDVNALPPVTGVQWVKDKFYLFVQGGIYTSTDGINWGPPSPPLVDTALDGSVGEAAGSIFFTAGDSIYLIGGSSLEVSTDGTHFKSLNPPQLQSVGGISANGLTIIYGNGGLATASDGIHFTLDGTLFSALATNGSSFVAAGYAGSGGPLFFSPDFVTWTAQPSVSASVTVYNGSKYVASGAGNTDFSADGTHWTDTPGTTNFTAMGYGAGRYVAGTFYSLQSSTDGVNWTEVDSSYSFYYKIRYLNNNFFALGMNFQTITGLILESADGINWKNITPQLDTTVTYYNDVMYDGTKYYFTGVKNFADFFTISTTDPTNTTGYGAMGGIVNPATGTSGVDYFPQFDDFIYHDGLFVGTVVDRLNSGTYLTYSTDGANWTTNYLGGSGNGQMTVSAADIYYIVAADGGYYTVSFAQAAPPVLLRFDAVGVPSFNGENSRLSWTTKNDSVIAYYLVQHSQDTIHWDSIGHVAAERRMRERRPEERYEFVQDDPPAGANYYRLGLTERDGRRTWSPVRKVEIRGQGISIYPNPARDVLHVRLPGAGRARLTVFNHAWLPVRQEEGSGHNISINLWSLPSGVYYLLVFQDGKRYSKEFFIE